jgi:hypothetical protein
MKLKIKKFSLKKSSKKNNGLTSYNSRIYEKIDSSEIKYCFSDMNYRNLEAVKIKNGGRREKYFSKNSEDTLIINLAKIRIDSLLQKKDSIDEATEKDRINFGLNKLERELE